MSPLSGVYYSRRSRALQCADCESFPRKGSFFSAVFDKSWFSGKQERSGILPREASLPGQTPVFGPGCRPAEGYAPGCRLADSNCRAVKMPAVPASFFGPMYDGQPGRLGAANHYSGQDADLQGISTIFTVFPVFQPRFSAQHRHSP